MNDQEYDLKMRVCQLKWALAHMWASAELNNELISIEDALSRAVDVEWNQRLLDEELDLGELPSPTYMEE